MEGTREQFIQRLVQINTILTMGEPSEDERRQMERESIQMEWLLAYHAHHMTMNERKN